MPQMGADYMHSRLHVEMILQAKCELINFFGPEILNRNQVGPGKEIKPHHISLLAVHSMSMQSFMKDHIISR